MSFTWPSMLWSLLIVPILLAIYAIRLARGRSLAVKAGDFGVIHKKSGRQIGIARHIPWALFLLGLTALMFALSRPQGYVTLPRMEGTVILAFDVSGSMAATDLQPTRMEAAKTAARAFVQHQPPSVQIGIVAFSDSGFSVQAPGNDQDATLAAIDRLTPERGTSLANGILVSLNTIFSAGEQATHFYSNLTPEPTPTPTPVPSGFHTSSIVILLSDGENNQQPDPLAAARLAADRGVRVYTVGLGSPSGISLHVNGFTVHTRLDEELLKQIAQLTGGTYFSAQSTQELTDIYDKLSPELVIKPAKMEITSILAGASALLLLAGGLYSLLTFGRIL
jgi:Ca-activated chloride channel family protein